MVRELLWDLHTIKSDEGKALFEMTVGQQNGPTVFCVQSLRKDVGIQTGRISRAILLNKPTLRAEPL